MRTREPDGALSAKRKQGRTSRASGARPWPDTARISRFGLHGRPERPGGGHALPRAVSASRCRSTLTAASRRRMNPVQSPPGGASTTRPGRQRRANRRQLVERTAALGARAQMALDTRTLRWPQLAVEVQLDVARLLAIAPRHTRPPAVTFACARAPRSRCTAACSWRFTVPSARPSASAISESLSP